MSLRFASATVAILAITIATAACVHERAPEPAPTPVVVTPQPQPAPLGPVPNPAQLCSEPDLETRRAFVCGRLLEGVADLDSEMTERVSDQLLGDPDVVRVPLAESELELAAGLVALCPANDSEQRLGAALLQARYYEVAHDGVLATAYLTLALDEPLALDVRHSAVVERGFGLLLDHYHLVPDACIDRWQERLRELYLDRCMAGDARLSVSRGSTAHALCQRVIDLRCYLLIEDAKAQAAAAKTPAEKLDPYLSLTTGTYAACSRDSIWAQDVLSEAHYLAKAAGEDELAHELAVRHDALVPIRNNIPICDRGWDCNGTPGVD